jgi:hypothetical protein
MVLARVARLGLAAVLLVLAFPAGAQMASSGDSTRAGRFDLGRMWTFENPPTEYFTRTYGFPADSAWFSRARLAALRIPGCSAALVSPHGLIVTNHHCVRDRIPPVARPGETLLDSGFVARDLADERRVPGLFADQLLAALDVSDEINASVDRARGDSAQAAARRRTGATIQARLRAQYASSGDSIVVQIVPLYSGGRTSGYVFRRLVDIRLVAAAELQMGFFGGDSDNFTYPRYALDFAVLRAYGPDGQPLATPLHFGWGRDGVRPGDVIFVIGNPGRTARLTTIAQLEYARDVTNPVTLRFLRSRLEAMRAVQKSDPDAAERIDLRNRTFGLSNSEKSLAGRTDALHDPIVMARRRDAERTLRDSIRSRPGMDQRYGKLFDQLAGLQQEKRRHAQAVAAYSQLMNPAAGSATLQRAILTWRIGHTTADSAAALRQALDQVASWPPELERRFLALALDDVSRAWGPGHPITRAALGDDAAESVADAVAPSMLESQNAMARLAAREAALAADIGRARYEVYGGAVPPDGSSSPRIADGVVQGYPYNGTFAPAWTTFYGMYDRFRAHGPGSEWDLPHRWRTPPAGLDLGTALNFVSTADTYGGNSGSPAVTKDLRLVGLNFDRNVNALLRDYIYLPDRGRNIMVDARAIQAALDVVYDLDRVVAELLTGRLFRTEAEADRSP